MPDHYYTPSPGSAHDIRTFTLSAGDRALRVHTDSGVFSREHLDPGSALLLKALPQDLTGQVLDMGCGWGALGLIIAATRPAASLTLADINQRALALCEKNFHDNGLKGHFVHSDGFAAITGYYDLIVTNPPIRAGKQVIYPMFADATRHLKPGGRLVLVIRKQQGAPSALAYLKTLYAHVAQPLREMGYWIIEAGDPITHTPEDHQDDI